MKKTLKPFTNINSNMIWIIERSSSLHLIRYPFALVHSSIVESKRSITFPYISNNFSCIDTFRVYYLSNFSFWKTVLLRCFIFVSWEIVRNPTWMYVSLTCRRNLSQITIIIGHECVSGESNHILMVISFVCKCIFVVFIFGEILVHTSDFRWF